MTLGTGWGFQDRGLRPQSLGDRWIVGRQLRTPEFFLHFFKTEWSSGFNKTDLQFWVAGLTWVSLGGSGLLM